MKLTNKQIENAFYECLRNGTVYYGKAAVLDFPSDCIITATENQTNATMNLRYAEKLYDVEVTVPVAVCNNVNILTNYINAQLILLERDWQLRNKKFEPVHTSQTAYHLARTCGFTDDEYENDERIYNYASALLSVDSTYKVSNRFMQCSLEEDEYYDFINNLHTNIKEWQPHVQHYDVIKCGGMNNIVVMYADNFNSVSLNWGTSYGMNVQTNDEDLIELRDKLIKRFPL